MGERILKTLNPVVPCPMAPLGCNARVRLDSLPHHEATECSKQPVPCPTGHCDPRMKLGVSEILGHLRSSHPVRVSTDLDVNFNHVSISEAEKPVASPPRIINIIHDDGATLIDVVRFVNGELYYWLWALTDGYDDVNHSYSVTACTGRDRPTFRDNKIASIKISEDRMIQESKCFKLSREKIRAITSKKVVLRWGPPSIYVVTSLEPAHGA